MTNSTVKNLLINKEGCKCLLTGYYVDKSQLTYHHIEKKEWGGKATVENGANLIGQIHSWLHCAIEYNDKELFILINECLLLYKQCMEQDKTELVEMFENECQPLFRNVIGNVPPKVKTKKKGKKI